MKKRLAALLTLLTLCAVLFSACSPGNVAGVELDYGASGKFSSEEIHAAMKVVMNEFQLHYKNCTMLKLWYDEEHSDRDAGWVWDTYRSADYIVLLCDFHTGNAPADGSLNGNADYTGYNFVLTRENGKWTIVDRGY